MKRLTTMKGLVIVTAVSGMLFACKANKSNAEDDTRVLSASDSAQLKELKKWKEDKEKSEKRTVVYREVSDKSTTSPAAATTVKKKGWSKAAKGAVIGGVTGAAAGAIINKRNRAAGAVIGGAVGAGVGYGIGRAKDKKDGRY